MTSGMIETEGLTHIHLRVRDLDRSLRFYQQAFGMEERFRDGDLVFLNTPGSQDLITLNPDHEGLAGQSGGIEHFGFRLKPGVDHDEAVEAVEAAGGRLIRRGEHAPGEPFAYVADPDGYVIEL
jgi:catechol 2,3-dioxygenase-like lactoylglutathione lyase family enzyme